MENSFCKVYFASWMGGIEKDGHLTAVIRIVGENDIDIKIL